LYVTAYNLFFLKEVWGMLPDISTRERLFGLDRKNYDGRMIKKILNIKKHDGCTTRNAVGIIKRINGYLDDSRCFVIQCSVIFMFLRDMKRGDIKADGNAILEAYCDNVDGVMIGQAMNNLMRITKSVAKQRSLAKAVKPVIKQNKLSSEWASLLNDWLDGLEKRIPWLRENIIPENMSYTPLGAYANYLSGGGVDVYDDIAKFVKNDGSVFDNGDETAQAYIDHVLGILSGLGVEDTARLLSIAQEEFDRRNKRLNRIASVKKREEAEKTRKAVDAAGEEVLCLCSAAGKKFRAERVNALKIRAKSYGDVYVVAAVRPFVNAMCSGYLTKRTKKIWCITNVRDARIFNTQEEAQKAADEFKTQGENLFAEVAKVELAAYGYVNDIKK
jgi:hypothetical protein